MGYSTDFDGQFNLDRPLTPEHKAYLKLFAETRRMKRDSRITEKRPDPVRLAADLPVGEQGCYFVGAEGFCGQEDTQGKGILDYNSAPMGQPGLWCQWTPAEDGAAIEWDGGEKFYDYVPWIKYIIDHFLKRWGYTLNGEVEWQGEDSDDLGKIVVTDNVVTVKRGRVIYE